MPQNASQAKRYFEKSAKQAYLPSIHTLAAEFDDPSAMVELGKRILIKDATNAAYWFRIAAHKNDVEGMLYFAQLCEQGIGIPRNRAAAVFWLDRASQCEEIPKVKEKLSLLRERFDSLQYAAQHGDANAMDILGQIYQEAYEHAEMNNFSEEEKMNFLKNAYYWFKKSAKEGFIFGMYDLACFYNKSQVPHKAICWYLKLIKKNENPCLHYELGMIYREVNKLEKAKECFQKAADLGHEPAKAELKAK
jgi:TPR repeat protein